MKILVLGHKGMLGHMVCDYLTTKELDVITTDYRYPSPEFCDKVKSFDGDYIINCIGSIPQKSDKFDINTELPIWLELNASSKIIHPGTDCEMDSDSYGISKKAASDYIINSNSKTKILKSSIIGPELNSNKSLLEWFLANEEASCSGYTLAMWNGVTTLEWAKQCIAMIYNWDSYPVETVLYTTCISKFDLLQTIAEIYNKNIEILPVNLGKDKCLLSGTNTGTIKEQLIELKTYYYDNKR
jgi:dTDP-4-dehydrorhamnose reductase